MTVPLDAHLTRLVVELAVNDGVRQQYSANKEAVIAERELQGMSHIAAAALRSKDDTIVTNMLINNQSNIHGAMVAVLDVIEKSKNNG